MKKLLFLLTAISFVSLLYSQDNPTPKKKKDWSKVKLTGRANDHLMMQYGYTSWSNKPDSINTSGFSRSFNIYALLDMPFKTDPRFSIAFGPGLGTDHIFFEKTKVDVAYHRKSLLFENLEDTTHFDKYKLATAYLELPIEFRFCMNPLNSDKSFKVAAGVKIGGLIDVHTKGKDPVDKNGKTIVNYADNFINKEKDKFYFNGTRFCVIGRIGYGNFTAFGTYQLGRLLKDGQGPDIRPLTIGLTLSGL